MRGLGVVYGLVLTLAGGAVLINPATADPADQPHRIKIAIPKDCMDLYYGPFPEPGERRPKSVEWDPASAKPLAFKDPRTSISYYVESDGRHVAAIDAAGKLLWVRNPYEDQKLCPMGNPRPSISSISIAEILPRQAEKMREVGKDPSHYSVGVKFDSRLYGVIDETNGNFYILGL